MKHWGLYLALSFLSLLSFHLSLLASAAQCGKKAGGAVCPKGLCCSQYGWCGTTNDYCGDGCQSQCNHGSGRSGSAGTTTHTDIDGCGAGGDDVVDGGTGSGGISSLISSSMFDEMFKHRNDGDCPGKGFYTYDAFIEAAKAYPAFGNTGDDTTRKREIAAFLAQTSHETTGGGSASEDGQFAWGFCYLEEQNPPSAYCDKSDKNHKCAPGKRFYGRGPIQLSWNYNYGPCGEALGVDLLNNPGLLITDPVISFKSALWFWMSATSRGPTCHEAITGKWSSMSMADRVKGGFGMVTNLINGPLECGKGSNEKVQDRIGYYKRYCDMLGISYGNNLDC